LANIASETAMEPKVDKFDVVRWFGVANQLPFETLPTKPVFFKE